MGVGIYLKASYPTSFFSKNRPKAFFQRVSTWLKEVATADEVWKHLPIQCYPGTSFDNYPMLSVALHPCGENLEIIAPKPGHLIFTNKTSTIGPGYHIALCQLLHRLGIDFKLQWYPAGEGDNNSQDETGYFFHNDAAMVEKAMLKHLKSMADTSLSMLQENGYTLTAWHIAIGHSYEDFPGDLSTPLGARSLDWVRAVQDNPIVGKDILPWWDKGITASFFQQRALSRLWTDVRWARAVDDEEQNGWLTIHRDLLEAFRHDPTISIPWTEWAELIDHLDHYDDEHVEESITNEERQLVREMAEKVRSETPLVGYRRYPITVTFSDGWQIKIPGSFAERSEDGSWSAWDEERTIWVSTMEVKKKDGTPVEARELLEAMELPAGETFQHKDGSMQGKACLLEAEENGEKTFQLRGYTAIEGRVATCTICISSAAHSTWAVEQWKMLKNPGDE
jgi:hypothetical protein